MCPSYFKYLFCIHVQMSSSTEQAGCVHRVSVPPLASLENISVIAVTTHERTWIAYTAVSSAINYFSLHLATVLLLFDF